MPRREGDVFLLGTAMSVSSRGFAFKGVAFKGVALGIVRGRTAQRF
jgi:hypothetical protein